MKHNKTLKTGFCQPNQQQFEYSIKNVGFRQTNDKVTVIVKSKP